MLEAPQIRATWHTDAPINPGLFRAAISRNLAELAGPES